MDRMHGPHYLTYELYELHMGQTGRWGMPAAGGGGGGAARGLWRVGVPYRLNMQNKNCSFPPRQLPNCFFFRVWSWWEVLTAFRFLNECFWVPLEVIFLGAPCYVFAARTVVFCEPYSWKRNTVTLATFQFKSILTMVSPGLATTADRCILTFCVVWLSESPNTSHLDSKSSSKLPNTLLGQDVSMSFQAALLATGRMEV